eukprot:5414525-Amphidinium_carterae.4
MGQGSRRLLVEECCVALAAQQRVIKRYCTSINQATPEKAEGCVLNLCCGFSMALAARAKIKRFRIGTGNCNLMHLPLSEP